MNTSESEQVIKEVRKIYAQISEYSGKADGEAFLSYYENSPGFISISSEGTVSHYEEFKKLCTDYYHSISGQEIKTSFLEFNLVDQNLVIASWNGDILATLKDGKKIKMDNYAVTSVFRKIGSQWKVIHDHESALPPEILPAG